MNMIVQCSAISSWIDSIQRFDPEYASYGQAYPDQVKLSAFGNVWNIAKGVDMTYGTSFSFISENKNSLRGRFMQASLNRAVRDMGQPRVEMLESILADAIAKHGEDEMAKLIPFSLSLYGETVVEEMQNAGLKFKNPTLISGLLCQAARDRQNEKPGAQPIQLH